MYGRSRFVYLQFLEETLVHIDLETLFRINEDEIQCISDSDFQFFY